MDEPTAQQYHPLQRVRASLANELQSKPLRPWWLDAAWLIAVQLGMAGVLIVAWSTFADISIHTGWSTLILAAVLVSSTLLAVRPGGQQKTVRGFLLVVFAAQLGAVIFGTSARAHSLVVFGDIDCAFAELGSALVPGLLAMFVLRGFSASTTRAILAGLAVGGTGLLVLNGTCPIGAASHAVAYHFVPNILLVAAFALIRARTRSHTFAP